jgi:chemotaxis protein histidine kinase CheA
MDETQFAERIAKIRARFTSKLADKLQETHAVLPHLTEQGNEAVEAVALTYRRFHELVGISATVGFEATGQSARAIDAILIGPFREQRSLSSDELAKLTSSLEALQETARAEMQSNAQSGS